MGEATEFVIDRKQKEGPWGQDTAPKDVPSVTYSLKLKESPKRTSLAVNQTFTKEPFSQGRSILHIQTIAVSFFSFKLT